MHSILKGIFFYLKYNSKKLLYLVNVCAVIFGFFFLDRWLKLGKPTLKLPQFFLREVVQEIHFFNISSCTLLSLFSLACLVFDLSALKVNPKI